jgi:hypothetical protein
MTTSIREYVAYVDAKKRVPQVLTTARAKALSDPRLLFRTACCLIAFSGHLYGPFKWNADATTIQIKAEGEGEPVYVVLKKDLNNDNLEDMIDDLPATPVSSSRHQMTTCLMLKWFHISNAEGQNGPLVAIIAVKGIPEGEFFVEVIPGLSHDSGPSSSNGFLYFAASRAGNPAMWRHFFQCVLIPTITSVAELYSTILKVSDNLPLHLQNLFFIICCEF